MILTPSSDYIISFKYSIFTYFNKLNMSLAAIKYKPGVFYGLFTSPIIVNVFPDPVCPNANTVTFAPLKKAYISGLTSILYIFF